MVNKNALLFTRGVESKLRVVNLSLHLSEQKKKNNTKHITYLNIN